MCAWCSERSELFVASLVTWVADNCEHHLELGIYQVSQIMLMAEEYWGERLLSRLPGCIHIHIKVRFKNKAKLWSFLKLNYDIDII